jgi:hypothetical protein
MRVGIIQSSYIPWRGYFDFIKSVDVFIIFDDIPYPNGRTWRNRNQIKTPTGLKWLTVPIRPGQSGIPMELVEIGESPFPWRDSHYALLERSLGPAPFFQDALNIWKVEAYRPHHLISQLNRRLIESICEYLDIRTKIISSSDFHVCGAKTKRLISLVQAIGGDTYLSGPVADEYLDKSLFAANDIRLEYKTYDYPEYTQLWGDYVPNVSVLDVIANLGKESKNYITSLTPNIRVL